MAVNKAMDYIQSMVAKGTPLTEEAVQAIIHFAATQSVEQAMKAAQLQNPLPPPRSTRQPGPGRLDQPFTYHAGSDRYGYIVTEVLDNGNTIKAEGFDSATNQRLNGRLCLTWRARANKGHGAWVQEGEKYRARGGGFSFGCAENYLDPSF